ncbi:dihydrofolate reductase [Ammoniphilus oxalaticus]|uniref:Dihydrofolate reductase n=1 Tax=Ammoniphilus oxalaticus TaxID=66863 RepID=A0A419SEG7_9BACL|nr:dihydrofolate reductase [Ammoniphilus oxalaticus]RKD21729.1 dihydrofolate reductase [Ammoniphilus oxalaticus]
MISFIVAMDRNRAIGVNNEMPWHLPADLAYFKRVTMGKPIIMGRKTHESIGRALPGRENIVLTRDPSYTSPGCRVIHSVAELEALCEAEFKNQEVFVIGGAELFRQTLEIADRLYITTIDEVFAGDTFFPEVTEAEWELTASEPGVQDEKNQYPHQFLVYDRKK